MPLQAPELDDRTFEQLVELARLRIPRYTREWTDFNDSDPGMTLVQLFAWLSEMLLHKLNQVPDRNYIKFLQLLNLELEPARPARAYLTFTPQQPLDPISIAPGTQVGAQPPNGGDMLIFETIAGLDVVPLPLTDVQVYNGAAFSRVSDLNSTPGTPFRPLGWILQPNSALYLGFGTDADAAKTDVRFPQHIHMRVFLPLTSAATRQQICGQDNQPPAPPVTLAWEYRPQLTPGLWRRLNVYKDDSGAFTREGDLVIEGPQDPAATKEGRMQDDKEKRFWLRCRLESGVYPAGHAPEIDFIRPNTIAADNRSTQREERVGVSDGRPDQTFVLLRRPVLFDSLKLRVEIGEEPTTEKQQWTRVDDLLGSGPDDLHYTLNHNSGEIRFGDGRRGEIPPASAGIIAEIYQYGGGIAGNLGPGLINAVLTGAAGVTVTNERGSAGGKDEQQLEDLKEEAPARIRCRDRAITAQDFIALAKQSGGIAKATAIPLHHPDYPGIPVPGAITVVIVPDSQDTPPTPTPEQLSAVCAYLDERRLLGSEVFVKAPHYREISVETRIESKPYVAAGSLVEAVQQALDTFLHPLGSQRRSATPSPNGPSKPEESGWEFGDDLHPTTLYSVIQGVAGVHSVRSLSLIVDGRPHDQMGEAVTLKPDELVYGRNHTIVVVPMSDR
ncbi:MAG TPA: putative baseplate assembly protein [Herpetosiphonaceae bacterium]